ncbi:MULTISPECIES: phosphoribosyltransferase family protein [unclassified Novosphingobium]|uniref:phosphoribosyltransferase n=1 Tax=unclassified Novosphingobium TaxID=2644732 RepID=UPI0025F5D0C5|nr:MULTISPECIES: phosphoribosyltransferase family protein [unclassified Novosphingobium]HQV03063.1 phosphoribosyltransferase family protein [Novosphingobium sp.]
MGDFLTWSGWVAGFIGLGSTLFFGFENRKLNRRMRSVDWSDVVVWSRALGKKVSKEFQPDMIYATDARGGMIAAIMQDSMNSLNVSLSGTTIWKDQYQTPPDLKLFEMIDDKKVAVGVLKIKASNDLQKVLIVDDLTVTGGNMERIKEIFVKKLGFAAENVKTCTLLASETSIANKRAPDYYHHSCASLDFDFPWGRVR